ncbi:MAG: hypothetical protein M1831_005005 [Alyxoria varia]|nr:MAG: hypothetical protein M1831_005005 [Alyxoria varia]
MYCRIAYSTGRHEVNGAPTSERLGAFKARICNAVEKGEAPMTAKQKKNGKQSGSLATGCVLSGRADLTSQAIVLDQFDDLVHNRFQTRQQMQQATKTRNHVTLGSEPHQLAPNSARSSRQLSHRQRDRPRRRTFPRSVGEKRKRWHAEVSTDSNRDRAPDRESSIRLGQSDDHLRRFPSSSPSPSVRSDVVEAEPLGVPKNHQNSASHNKVPRNAPPSRPNQVFRDLKAALQQLRECLPASDFQYYKEDILSQRALLRAMLGKQEDINWVKRKTENITLFLGMKEL